MTPTAETTDGPPYEGVPPWLRASLINWLVPIVRGDNIDSLFLYNPNRPPIERFALQAERNLHLRLDWRNGPDGGDNSLLRRMQEDDDAFLSVIGFALARLELGYDGYAMHNAVERLETIFREGGSVWEVDRSSQPPRLRRRVTTAAATSMANAKASAGHAGELLDEAWDKAFGRNPEPSAAYSKAIKAVEAAAIPIVSPNDSLATLGRMIGSLRATPAKWKTPFANPATIKTASGQSEDLDGVLAIAAQMDLLWRNQTDRHGTPNPQSIEQHHAEAAVHEAMALVHLLIGGALTPAAQN